jgi:ammonium transporter, Amt family
MGGIIGLLFNGLFADKNLVALDGVTSVSGGWLNHNYKQLYIQFAYVCATVGYTFVVTALLAKLLDVLPAFRLRASPEEEALGMDDTQIGEFVSDYVEVRRDYRDWTPAYGSHAGRARDGSETGSSTPTAAGDRHGKPDTDSGSRQPSPVMRRDNKPQDGLEVISEKPAEERV